MTLNNYKDTDSLCVVLSEKKCVESAGSRKASGSTTTKLVTLSASTPRTVIVFLLTVLISGGCTRAERADPNGAAYERELQTRLRPTYRIRRPAVPSTTVVLVVPGCSGFGPKHYDSEGARLTEEGFIVINVDYLSARELSTACPAPGDTLFPVPASVIARYVLAAAADVRSDTLIRPTRVMAVGGSLGGGGVLATLSTNRMGAFPLDGVVALYPQCRGVSRWDRPVPVLMLLGGLDNIASPTTCRALAGGKDSTAGVIVVTYPRAHHAFDADELPIVTERRTDATVGYNPQAAADAWHRITNFIHRLASPSERDVAPTVR
jgi:dienelactone hydrolase